jgi:hypothetical protein
MVSDFNQEKTTEDDATRLICTTIVRIREKLGKLLEMDLSASVGNDHTNMTAPLPVRSAKLSMFGPG